MIISTCDYECSDPIGWTSLYARIIYSGVQFSLLVAFFQSLEAADSVFSAIAIPSTVLPYI